MNTSNPFRSFDLDSTGADPSFVGHRLAQLRREQNIPPRATGPGVRHRPGAIDGPLFIPDAERRGGVENGGRPDGLGGEKTGGPPGRHPRPVPPRLSGG